MSGCASSVGVGSAAMAGGAAAAGAAGDTGSDASVARRAPPVLARPSTAAEHTTSAAAAEHQSRRPPHAADVIKDATGWRSPSGRRSPPPPTASRRHCPSPCACPLRVATAPSSIPVQHFVGRCSYHSSWTLSLSSWTSLRAHREGPAAGWQRAAGPGGRMANAILRRRGRGAAGWRAAPPARRCRRKRRRGAPSRASASCMASCWLAPSL